MTDTPDFDELVGGEPTGAERERLRRAHELLLAAGAPPELPPSLEAGPTLAMTLSRRPRRVKRRAMLLVAAAIAVGAVFLGGYLVGHRGGSSGAPSAVVIQLRGTAAAPSAVASLRVEASDAAGNWPMTLSERGLPVLPEHSYYAVYVVRNGKPWAPCGWFVVKGGDVGTTIRLSAPYDLEPSDSWIVTEQVAGRQGPGETMLQPVT